MNTTRNRYHWIVPAILSVTLPTALAAQDAVRAEPASKPAKSIVKHDTVIGAAVTNGQDGELKQELGEISNLVVDRKTGHMRHAILTVGDTMGVGGRKVAVAWKTLKWDGENSRFTLAMTPEALERMPLFNPDELQKLNGADTVEAGSGKGDDPEPAGHRGGADEPRIATAAARKSERLALATKIAGYDVYSGTEKIGSAGTLYLEPEHGRAAFLSVSSGGIVGIGDTDYIVPFAAARFVTPMDKDTTQIQLDKDKASMQSAPKMSDDGADLEKAGFRKKVYDFYGVKPPKTHGLDDSSDDSVGQARRGSGSRK